MGMYDEVDYRMLCPTCEAELSDFQTKEGACVLGRLDWKRVGNFYTFCDNCKSWIEFTRKPAKDIDEFDMVVEKAGRRTN